VKIRLLTLSILFSLAACSSDSGNNNGTGLEGGAPMPLLDTTTPDDDPMNGVDGPMSGDIEPANTLPPEFTGGASLADSQYHWHCDDDAVDPGIVFVAFYDDRTAALLSNSGDELATWTVSGNDVILDAPDLNRQLSFDDVTFVSRFTFTTTFEQEQELSCTAFEDVTEIPLEGPNDEPEVFSIDGLSNGATLESATNAWSCVGTLFNGGSGAFAFFDDMDGILMAGANTGIDRTTWEAIAADSVQIMGEFDTIVLQSLTVDGNNMVFTNATQNGSNLGPASCSRQPATFTVNNAANQNNAFHAANF